MIVEDDLPGPIVFTVDGAPHPHPGSLFMRRQVVAARKAMGARGWRIGDVAYFTGPVRVEAVFTFATGRADRVALPRGAGPDADPLAKGLIGALAGAGCFADQAQAVDVRTRALWGLASSTVVRVSAAGRRPMRIPMPRMPPGWLPE